MAPFAVALRNRIRGLTAAFTTTVGGTKSIAVAIGFAMAKFLGTSSPKTIWIIVARIRAIAAVIATKAPSWIPGIHESIGVRIGPIALSTTNPRVSELTVIPS